MAKTSVRHGRPLALPELARKLGVSRVTVFNRVRAGLIRAQKVGSSYVVSGEEADRLLRQRVKKIDCAVSRAVAEYGPALERLGRE